ncbi:MAG: glycosyltransferase [Candidatus Sulfobium sp.]
MEEENPRVSIIVRTKDRPKLLKVALASISGQTYRPLEVILINDGGCELDPEELKTLLKDVSLTYIRLEKNRGRAHAGNAGIENAKGDYIGFLDDDDEFVSDHIESLYEHMKDRRSMICYSDCEIRRTLCNREDGSFEMLSKEPFFSYDFNLPLLLFSNFIPLICALFSREVFEAIGRFDETFELYEDWDLFIRAGTVFKLEHLARITAVYNKWNSVEQITQSSVGQNSERDRFYYQKIIDKHREKYTPAVFYEIYDIYNHISSRYSSSIAYGARLESEKGSLENQIEKLEAEKTRLERAEKRLESEKGSLENGIRKLERDQEERLRDLAEHNARLSSVLSRIHSSRGWRLLTKYYRVKEFVLGTDDTPAIGERLMAFMKKTAKRFLPKKAQIYLKLYAYRFFGGKGKKVPGRKPNAEKPFFSIIIPVYNRSRFLRQSLDSALNQDYDSFEVVAVDDLSTEYETNAILSEFSKKYNNLKVFYNERNSGISETLNRALVNSGGNYIAFLDCDDFLPPFALSRTAQDILDNPDKGYFFSDRINVDVNGKEVERETFINRRRDNYLRELMKGMFTDHLKVLRRDCFVEIGLLDRQYDSVQDYDFALRYAYRRPTGFCYVNDYLYFHRVYPEQISSLRSTDQTRLAERAVQITRQKISISKGTNPKKVSVVILSFNKKEHTVKCVNLIKSTVAGDFEIILFDNGSGSDTVDLLKQTFGGDEKVRLVFSAENLGCPKGRKKAISCAGGDYIVTLDNDIIVTPGWIEELILSVEADPSIAGACCRVIFPDNKIQYNGGRASVRDGFVRFSLIDAWKNAHDLATMRKYDCDWIPGGATLYKRTIYEKISICDEFENAYEDNDFSFNVKKLGYRVVNCPSAKVVHNHVYYDKSAASDKDYMESRYDHEALKRSVVAFYKRHGLIIEDEYIYKIFGLSGLDDKRVKEKFLSIVEGLSFQT